MNGALQVFRYPAFARFTGGNIASLLCVWMQRVVVGWLAWEFTGSGTWLGLIAFADLFPAVVLAPFAGVAADRWNQLRMLAQSQVAGLLITLTLGILSLAGLLEIWGLLLLTLLLGSVFAITMPLRLAIVSLLLPREALPAGVAINSVTYNLARFVGPAIAGVLIAYAGVTAAIFVSAGGYLVFAVTLRFVQPAAQGRLPQRSEPFLRQIGDGIAYAARHFGIRALLILTVTVSIGARPLVEMLPGFAGAVYGVGAIGLSNLTSAVGVGAVLGGLFVMLRGAEQSLITIGFVSTGGLAASVLALTMTSSFTLALSLLVVVGFCLITGSIVMQTAVQLATDPRMRGRVLSLYTMLLRGVPALGAVAVGVLSELIGLRLATACGAIGLAAATLFMALRAKAISESLRGPPDGGR